ncbi:tetratricopeptide repeat-containing glycosyltransferase family protein [Telmatospirillum sp.]|uniref:tetratricopeptide repeat-containing glycosyltransferase family protein n=1 Tax=Telmatospirillum sp. TaxID=2079197 RepID=UPI00283BF8BF|nr:tetratricopeptide repeat-containing glycosyltransferase family protein [Telmatospirillum sp.]MDR3437976.1 tetratricopeptide repeat-containing glycosyltransferase family protein [Telmatospirillum sp.]
MNRKQRRAADKTAGRPIAQGDAKSLRFFEQAVRHHEAGRLDQAVALYRQAIDGAPREAELHYNLGLALAQMGRREDAVAAWRMALDIRPLYPKASNNLGKILAELGRLEEAENSLRLAAALAPDIPEIPNNLAGVLRQQGAWQEAETLARRAISLFPTYADAYNHLGILEADQRRLRDAIATYRRALRLEPNNAKAHFHLGLALLTVGELTEGWAEYEWRWKGGGRHLTARPLGRKQWQGEDITGRRILLHAEQGFGDTLQFIRFAKPLADSGATVIVEAPGPLLSLLTTMAGVSEVVEQGSPLPPFDVHLPLLSLPHHLGIVLNTIPAEVPYLTATDTAVAAWHERLTAYPRPWVGVVWAGDARPDDPFANATDRRRSLRLDALSPLLDVPGVTFVSLQKGEPAKQLSAIPEHRRPLDWTDRLIDFADTAALTANLDLVITVDTAMAHLAGALGRPVWIASRFDGCWRWLADRDDSPWYPTARLFRQAAPGMWQPVIAAMTTELAAKALPITPVQP